MLLRAVSSTTVTVDRVASVVGYGESGLVRPDAGGPGEGSVPYRRTTVDVEFTGDDA